MLFLVIAIFACKMMHLFLTKPLTGNDRRWRSFELKQQLCCQNPAVPFYTFIPTGLLWNINILMRLQRQLPFRILLNIIDDERRHGIALVPFGLKV